MKNTHTEFQEKLTELYTLSCKVIDELPIDKVIEFEYAIADFGEIEQFNIKKISNNIVTGEDPEGDVYDCTIYDLEETVLIKIAQYIVEHEN